VTRSDIHSLLQEKGYDTTPDYKNDDLEDEFLEELESVSPNIGCTYYQHESDEKKWMATWPVSIEDSPDSHEWPKRLKYDYAEIEVNTPLK
jgi:hypothetical protein